MNNTENFAIKTETLTALIDIQNSLSVRKDKLNEFGNFNYYTTSDVLSALKPLLREKNATVIFENNLVTKLDRVYVESRAYFVCNGGVVSATGLAREEDKPTSKRGASQETGSATSYAQKYALNSLFLISEDASDPDAYDGTRSQNEHHDVRAYESRNVSNDVMQQAKANTAPVQELFAEDKLKEQLQRGIQAAIKCGADEEQVYVWGHEMSIQDAIIDIANFVNTKVSTK